MDIASRADAVGVGVRVRVQPQHHERLAGFAAMLRDGGDGPDGQAVIAAHQNGERSLRHEASTAW